MSKSAGLLVIFAVILVAHMIVLSFPAVDAASSSRDHHLGWIPTTTSTAGSGCRGSMAMGGDGRLREAMGELSVAGDKYRQRRRFSDLFECTYAMEDAGALSICADLVSFTNLKKITFHGDDLAMIVGIGGLGIIIPNFKDIKWHPYGINMLDAPMSDQLPYVTCLAPVICMSYVANHQPLSLLKQFQVLEEYTNISGLADKIKKWKAHKITLKKNSGNENLDFLHIYERWYNLWKKAELAENYLRDPLEPPERAASAETSRDNTLSNERPLFTIPELNNAEDLRSPIRDPLQTEPATAQGSMPQTETPSNEITTPGLNNAEDLRSVIRNPLRSRDNFFSPPREPATAQGSMPQTETPVMSSFRDSQRTTIGWSDIFSEEGPPTKQRLGRLLVDGLKKKEK